jgi:hypothetical protein
MEAIMKSLIIKSITLLLLIYSSSAAAVSDDIRDTDFSNFDYPGFKCLYIDKLYIKDIKEECFSAVKECFEMGHDKDEIRELTAFQLKDGSYDLFPEEQMLPTRLDLQDVLYGDFDNNNVLDALVVIGYSTVITDDNSDYIAYMFTMNNGEVTLMNKFSNVPDVSLMKELKSKLKGFNSSRFDLKVMDNRVYVSDGFGGRGRCCPEYLVTFIGEFVDSGLKWSYTVEPYQVSGEKLVRKVVY